MTALPWVEVGLIAVLLFLLVPTTVFFIQACAAAVATDAREPSAGERPRIAVLVPAHNESAGIATTLRSVMAQLAPGDRLVVVADNCSDDTAAVAAAAGAEVLVREDPIHRGKGYALDFGVRGLRADPPDVVVVVDADCTLGDGCLARVAREALSTARPVQARYLLRAPPKAGLAQRMAELACVVKNQVRPLGFHRLGLPCQLMGSGMAFRWDVIFTMPLASGHLVEDLQLGLDFASAGMPPVFCPSAEVLSQFPAARGLPAQRTRWEHGHLSVIVSRGWKLLCAGLVSRNVALVAMAVDLCVPPLALLASMLGVTFLGSTIFWFVVGGPVPLWLALAAMVMLALGVLVSWWRFGRRIVKLEELLLIPAYMIAKIPIYVGFLRRRQTEWVRTPRGDDER